jgi:hypothetical protein
MIYFLQTYRSDFIPWVILVFIAISVLSNIVKKLSQSGQKPPTGPPGSKPVRKSFVDLIEEVRRMAEEGQQKPPGLPKGEKTPTAFTQPRKGPQPRPTVRTPVVPRLKPIGQIRQPSTRKPVTRLVADQKEIRAKAEREKVEQRARELRERARVEREEKRKQAERARVSAREGATRPKQPTDFDALKRRYATRGKTITAAAAPKAVDFSRLFQSRKTLRDAIVLREILGPPRSMRRYTSRQR